MKYYAIADLHGRYDLLDKSLNVIKDRIEDLSSVKIITLGDYIDRGPESMQIIARLIEEQEKLPLICLKGNHEDMVVQTIQTPLDPDWWLGNGGNTTMKSYGSSVKVSPYYGIPPVGWDPHVVYPSHVEWMENLPLFYETEKHVFVHAGVPADDLDLEDQDKEQLMWMLYGKNDSGGYRGKHVVHGHHQFADGPHQWLDAKRGGRTDLDTFAWNTGRITIGVFDDTQLHAIDFIDVEIK